MRRLALLTCAIGFLLAAPAGAASTDPEQLAALLDTNVVYVDAKANPQLSIIEAGELRLLILDRDLGRIKIGVLPTRGVKREGGVTKLARTALPHLQTKGTLIVVAGTTAGAATTFAGDDRVNRALKSSLRAHRGNLAAGLRRAVRRIASIDPGPGGDGDTAAGSRPAVPTVQVPGLDEIEGAVEAAEDALGIGQTIIWIAGLSFAIFGFVLMLAVIAIAKRRRVLRRGRTFTTGKTQGFSPMPPPQPYATPPPAPAPPGPFAGRPVHHPYQDPSGYHQQAAEAQYPPPEPDYVSERDRANEALGRPE